MLENTVKNSEMKEEIMQNLQEETKMFHQGLNDDLLAKQLELERKNGVKNIEKLHVVMSDGSLLNFAKGAKFNFQSALNEFIDNASDANAEVIYITIPEAKRNERKLIYIESKQDALHIEDINKLYQFGASGHIKSEKDKIGKYKQGFKLASAYLIGEGNDGIVQVQSSPVNGTPWTAVQKFDYTNTERGYCDNEVEYHVTDYNEFKHKDCNFGVYISTKKNFNFKEIDDIKVKLGLRHREGLENKSLVIKVNEDSIKPQDRLYSKFNQFERGEETFSVYDEEGNFHKHAIKVEWVYLQDRVIDVREHIKYDSEKSTKSEGLRVTKRSLGEFAYNHKTLIYDGLYDAFLPQKISTQPQTSGFRFRVTFLDSYFADLFLEGTNKSDVSLNSLTGLYEGKGFENFRKYIKDKYSDYMRKYGRPEDNEENEELFKCDEVKELIKDKNLDCVLKVSNWGGQKFIFREGKTNILKINIDDDICKGLKKKTIKRIIYQFFYCIKDGSDTTTIYKNIQENYNLMMSYIK